MSSRAFAALRKKPVEVINLISSDEDDVKPAKSITRSREPLAPRITLPSSTPNSLKGKQMAGSVGKASKLDLKPIILSDKEDIKPAKKAFPSPIGNASRTTNKMKKSRPVEDMTEPTVVSTLSLSDVKAELELIADTLPKTQPGLAIPTPPKITASINDLFSGSSPECTPYRTPPSTFPSSPSSTVVSPPTVSTRPPNNHSDSEEDDSSEDDGPILQPAFWNEPSSSGSTSHTSSARTAKTPNRGGVPILPKSSVSKARFERLQALVTARQTPVKSRRALRLEARTSPDNSVNGDDEDILNDDVLSGNEGEDVAEDYDLARHYDTSLGSLRDFIVDDSDSEEIETAAIFLDTDSEADEPKRTSRPKSSETEGCDHNHDYDLKARKVIYDSEDDGILSFSPIKRPIKLPDLSTLQIFDYDEEDERKPPSHSGKNPTRSRRPIRTEPKNRKDDPGSWNKNREEIARKIFDELDKKVFEGRLSETKLVWNKRLTSTAGVAKGSREKQPDGTRKTVAKIELSDKVLSSEDQINNTVAHEMCHVACYVISDAWKEGHGRIFKSWKVMRARPDIEVTTTHNYTIEFKYVWKCGNEGCWVVYRRHSKSIDISTERCYRCRGKLVPQFETKTATPFQVYLRENLKLAKSSMPGASHGDVMRALSERWKEAPGEDHQAHWKAVLAASGL